MQLALAHAWELASPLLMNVQTPRAISAIFPANGSEVVLSAGRHSSSSGIEGSMQKVSFTTAPWWSMHSTVRTC
jgi:hypothetical protein